MKTLTILGSTGSIGTSTLAVVREHPEKFKIFALTGRQRLDVLAEQCLEFSPRYAVVESDQARSTLTSRLASLGNKTEILVGTQALCDVASASDVDMVMAAIVGAAGLAPTLAAARAGKKLLLANKESLVVAGHVLMAAVANSGGSIVPIDSEHSAIFQCLPASKEQWKSDVHRLVLTASGGPFLNSDLNTLAYMTPAQAVAHPNWSMGRKISVDSATMMNKALEVIEAHFLFGFAPSQIDVVIHPQSIIHSMVEMTDGSLIAQLGTPDMRTPIALGLAFPERIATGAPRLDLFAIKALEFTPMAHERYPALRLAYEALSATAGATTVLNAANEVAVQAFLDGKIAFTRVAALCADVLASMKWRACSEIEGLIALDDETRAFAAKALNSSIKVMS
jgi:1-deoxy-D-xylulose-5-phosphate reductoisomerase